VRSERPERLDRTHGLISATKPMRALTASTPTIALPSSNSPKQSRSRRHGEQRDHGTPKLMGEDGECSDSTPRDDRVQSVQIEPPLRFLLGKPRGDRDAECAEHLVRRPCVGEVWNGSFFFFFAKVSYRLS
jgi:hypothetical protein